MDRLTIGTRGSELAVWQARTVSRLLSAVCDLPIEIELIRTAGDRLADIPLSSTPGKGFFTRELEDALLERRIDLAVHSLKDLPIDLPPGLAIASMCCREDPRDVLITLPRALDETQTLGIGFDAIVGTSSVRRSFQLLSLMPSLRIRDLRGNVPTRVKKLRDGSYDAIVIASAGIKRLGLDLSDLSVMILSEDLVLPAPAQGILAVETRHDDAPTRGIVAKINDAAVCGQAAIERGLLARLGGGCSMPLGALATGTDGELRLRAALAIQTNRSTVVRRADVRGSDAEEIIEIAYRELCL